MNEQMERALAFIRDKASEKAAARGDRVYLEEFRKSKKALLKIQARQAGITADCACEDFAYSHEDYIQLLTALQIAVEKEEKLRLQILAAELRIATWQTMQADARSERRGYGA